VILAIHQASAEIFYFKQKLEGQPEFFGNASLGYDIGGFSVRILSFSRVNIQAATRLMEEPTLSRTV